MKLEEINEQIFKYKILENENPTLLLLATNTNATSFLNELVIHRVLDSMQKPVDGYKIFLKDKLLTLDNIEYSFFEVPMILFYNKGKLLEIFKGVLNREKLISLIDKYITNYEINNN